MTKAVPVTLHARLSASSAERWMNCPGSVAITAGKGSTSEAAAQGTYAHHIAATCLLEPTRRPADWLGNKTIIDGFTIECDQEMVDGVQFYLDELAEGVSGDDVHHIEVGLIEALAKLDKDLGGTADYVRWNQRTHELLVADFKYGAGVVVPAEDNRQLKMYALGTMLKLGVPAATVTVRIIQPRIEVDGQRVRDFSFAGFDILEFAADVVDAAKAVRKPDAPLVPGTWCKKTFCPAVRTCPALEKHQHDMIALDFQPVSDVVDYGKVAEALAMIEPLKAKIKALEEFAYQSANAGNVIPGWKLVDKQARRKYTDEAAAIEWAKSKAIDPYEAPSVKSPAQLEKLVKKAEREEMWAFVAKVSSGTTLVPESDPRVPANLISSNDFPVLDAPGEVQQKSVKDLF